MNRQRFPAVEERHLQKRAVIYIPLSAKEGLVLKAGYTERRKYVTIVGFTKDGSCIGALLVNTRPSSRSKAIEDCQFPLNASDYPLFLSYKSWLDCSKLVRISREKVLNKGKYCGGINDKDWAFIEDCLKQNPVIPNKEKKNFGIIP
jgi:hypothetical protein